MDAENSYQPEEPIHVPPPAPKQSTNEPSITTEDNNLIFPTTEEDPNNLELESDNQPNNSADLFNDEDEWDFHTETFTNDDDEFSIFKVAGDDGEGLGNFESEDYFSPNPAGMRNSLLDPFGENALINSMRDDQVCGRPTYVHSESLFKNKPLVKRKKREVPSGPTLAFGTGNQQGFGSQHNAWGAPRHPVPAPTSFNPMANFQQRIVGGSSAVQHSWPWSILLNVCIDYSWAQECFKCGAVLIGKNWALTAGHCLPKNRKLEIKVELGKHFTDTPATTRKVKSTILHHNFRKIFKDGIGVIEHDVGLIEFDKTVEYNERIRPACLPDKDLCIKPGTVCVVTGWGYTDEAGKEGFPEELQQAPVKIFDNDYCRKFPNYGVVTDNMMCAGWEDGEVDACGGDSGGPLSCKTGEADDAPWVLAGTVSWGIGCARRNSPGVYSNVAKYAEWITKETGLNPGIEGNTINSGQCIGANAPKEIISPEKDVVAEKEAIAEEHPNEPEYQCLFNYGLASNSTTSEGVKFGKVKSPEHPLSYTSDSKCRWCFQGDQIKIRFRELRTNQKQWTCDEDKDRFTFEVSDGKIVKEVCYWKHIRENFVFKNQVCLNWKAGGYAVGRKPQRWKFEYKISSNKQLEKEAAAGGQHNNACPMNGFINATTVQPLRLSSPNFPNQYPDGLKCMWTIQSSVPNFPINLNIEKQVSRWERGCKGDIFVIYGGVTCQEVRQKRIKYNNRKYARVACGVSRPKWIEKLNQLNRKTKYCVVFRTAATPRSASGSSHYYKRQTKDSGFTLTAKSIEIPFNG